MAGAIRVGVGLAGLLLVFTVRSVEAACTGLLELSTDKTPSVNAMFNVEDPDCKTGLLPDFVAGTTYACSLRGARYAWTGQCLYSADRVFDSQPIVLKDFPRGAEDGDFVSRKEKLTLTIHGKDVSVTLLPDLTQAREDLLQHKLTIGPAADGNGTANGSPTKTNNALRVNYDFAYAAPLGKALHLSLKASVDTTDQAEGFVDYNYATVGLETRTINVGRLITFGHAGIEARYERPFHTRSEDVDVVARVSGYLPLFESLSLGGARYIAPPLAINLSFGYRRRKEGSASHDGTVFEGEAVYHLYLATRFRADLSYRISVTRLGEHSPAMPATQRFYKVSLAYLADPAAGFKVVTSYEDGSIGPVLAKLKQYFIGLGLNLDL